MTALEYAFVLALVVVVALGSITFLQSATEDDLDERATNAGAPDLGTGSSLPPTTAAPTTTAPIDPGTTAPSNIAVTVGTSGSGAKIGSDWIATVVLTVTDSSGNPIPGVAVTAGWSNGVQGLTSCISGSPSGSCSVSTNEIDRRGHSAIPSVTLTVLSVSGSGVVASGALPSQSVDAP